LYFDFVWLCRIKAMSRPLILGASLASLLGCIVCISIPGIRATPLRRCVARVDSATEFTCPGGQRAQVAAVDQFEAFGPANAYRRVLKPQSGNSRTGLCRLAPRASVKLAAQAGPFRSALRNGVGTNLVCV